MYRTAYVELNGTHEILSLSKTADEKVFTYKNVDFLNILLKCLIVMLLPLVLTAFESVFPFELSS